jgi:hypothetical protein
LVFFHGLYFFGVGLYFFGRRFVFFSVGGLVVLYFFGQRFGRFGSRVVGGSVVSAVLTPWGGRPGPSLRSVGPSGAFPEPRRRPLGDASTRRVGGL